MVGPTATAMDALDISEFLSEQGTGVLALAKSGSVYAFPVSFAYDEADTNLFFRLGYGPDSQKRAYVENGDEASIVVYDRTDDGWKSVLAEGQLESVSVSQLDTSVEEAVKDLHIPYFQVHREPSDELEFTIVRFEADKLSGIVEAQPSR